MQDRRDASYDYFRSSVAGSNDGNCKSSGTNYDYFRSSVARYDYDNCKSSAARYDYFWSSVASSNDGNCTHLVCSFVSGYPYIAVYDAN
jgi:hypothetical protein